MPDRDRRWFLDLERHRAEDAPAEPAVTVLPLPYEGTVSWGRGTAAGPAALLEASTQVEWWDEELEREPCQVGVETAPPPAMPEEPAGAVEVARRETARVLASGRLPVVLGGEHSLSYGVYLALAERHPDLGVVQLDAHADLREQYEGQQHSHACVMARVREHTADVVQLGVRSLCRREAERIEQERLAVGMMHHLRAGRFDARAALEALPEKVFLTFDVDALDLSLVRATGTPEPGGFSWQEINELLRLIFETREVVGLDVMELCGGDPASAFCAARLVNRMIGLRFQP